MLLFHVFVQIPTSMGFGIHTWRCSCQIRVGKSSETIGNRYKYYCLLVGWLPNDSNFPQLITPTPSTRWWSKSTANPCPPNFVVPPSEKMRRDHNKTPTKKHVPGIFFAGCVEMKMATSKTLFFLKLDIVLKVELAGYLLSFVLRPPQLRSSSSPEVPHGRIVVIRVVGLVRPRPQLGRNPWADFQLRRWDVREAGIPKI